MSARTHSYSWRCPLPGCRGCGAGYPSESAAVAAGRRHVLSAPSSHGSLLGQQAGGAR